MSIRAAYGDLGVVTSPSIPEDEIYVVEGNLASALMAEAITDCLREDGTMIPDTVTDRYAELIKARLTPMIKNIGTDTTTPG